MSRLDDGYQSLITFAADPTVLFYEKEVTPPAVEGGGLIEITTQQNSVWRTRAPKSLLTLGEAGLVVAYDPGVYPEIIALINVITWITHTMPDNSTLGYYGWLDNFVAGAHVEGEQPTADCTIIPSNQGGVGGAEAAPVYAGSGTTTTTPAP
jgi:hypothetical protein